MVAWSRTVSTITFVVRQNGSNGTDEGRRRLRVCVAPREQRVLRQLQDRRVLPPGRAREASEDIFETPSDLLVRSDRTPNDGPSNVGEASNQVTEDRFKEPLTMVMSKIDHRRCQDQSDRAGIAVLTALSQDPLHELREVMPMEPVQLARRQLRELFGALAKLRPKILEFVEGPECEYMPIKSTATPKA